MSSMEREKARAHDFQGVKQEAVGKFFERKKGANG
jgi:hypothetical protein